MASHPIRAVSLPGNLPWRQSQVYPWLRTTDGGEMCADLHDCSQAEADRRLVIAQEVSAGRVRVLEPLDSALLTGRWECPNGHVFPDAVAVQCAECSAKVVCVPASSESPLARAEDVRLEDVQIDTYRGGRTSVTVTHKPTGLVVTCDSEASELRCRERAMRELAVRVAEREATGNIVGTTKEAEDGEEPRR